MKVVFTENEIKEGLHKIYLEEQDVSLEGQWIEGEGKSYIIGGIAIIEGERYHEFQIEFELVEEPKEMTATGILSIDWDWYDFIC